MKYMFLLIVFDACFAFAADKTVTVTVVSAESVRQDTGYSAANATGSCVGQNCQASSTESKTYIPVRFLYVIMDGQHIRLHAKQKFMSSYGKTLPPGEYRAEWKNSSTLVIHYTEKDKPKTANYEMAGIW